ncbi:MAG: SoxR reducing system RseC family protein [Clostridia bacterium]|nr:SoxR reducing system RseC family protein [Clostridia bacterium]
MAEKTGLVVKALGQQLTVSFCRDTDCGKCNACFIGRKNMLITLNGEAKEGDRVVVQMPEAGILKASALAYAIPLAGLLAGLGIGNALGGNDLYTGLGGLTGLALSLLAVRLADSKVFKREDAYQMKLVGIIPSDREEKDNEFHHPSVAESL